MEATEEEELIDVMDGATHESCGGEEESSASRAFAVVSPSDEVHASVAAEARLIVVDGATHESCGGEEESSAIRAFAVVSPSDEVHASVATTYHQILLCFQPASQP